MRLQEIVYRDPATETTVDTLVWFRENYDVKGLDCTYWENQPTWFLEPRKKWNAFFLLVVRGELQATVGEDLILLGQGDLLMVPDGMPHHFHALPRGGPLHQFAFHAHLDDGAGESLLWRTSTRKADLSDELAQLTPRLHLIHQMMRRHRGTGRKMLEDSISTLVEHLILHGLDLERDPPGRDPRISRTLTRLKADLKRDWSISELARDCQWSPVTFRKRFREQVGESPKRFLIHRRMAEACRRLHRSQDLVKDIAHEVGYPDEHHFQRVFRQWIGHTPSEHRQDRSL